MGATPGPLLHGPAGMAPPGVLGLGPLASHRAGVSADAWAGERPGGVPRVWRLFCPPKPLSPPLPAPADEPVPRGGPALLQPARPTADVLSSSPSTVPTPPGRPAGTGGSEGLWTQRQTPLTLTKDLADSDQPGTSLSLSLLSWDVGVAFSTESMSWGPHSVLPKALPWWKQGCLQGL